MPQGPRCGAKCHLCNASGAIGSLDVPNCRFSEPKGHPYVPNVFTVYGDRENGRLATNRNRTEGWGICACRKGERDAILFGEVPVSAQATMERLRVGGR